MIAVLPPLQGRGGKCTKTKPIPPERKFDVLPDDLTWIAKLVMCAITGITGMRIPSKQHPTWKYFIFLVTWKDLAFSGNQIFQNSVAVSINHHKPNESVL